MNDDAHLLRQFSETRDETCFRELVQRRIGFVYAINLRRLRDAHLAQDATQAVFVALARKAARVAESPSVMGWLHRSSCYESRNLLRAQSHRLARETVAHQLSTTDAPGSAVLESGAEIAVVIDEILSELSEDDRDAILARYFSDQTYAEIGAVTGRSENAARMRVERALTKLRDRLQRRGFASTAAVLAATLPAYATTTVPATVAVTVTHAALTAIGAAAIPVAFFTLMNTTKIATTALIAATLGVVGFEIHKTNRLENELGEMRKQLVHATDNVRDLETKLSTVKTEAISSAQQAASSKTVSAAPSISTPAPSPEVPGITRKAPTGWFANGSNTKAYHVGVDTIETWGGMPSAYVESIDPKLQGGFGGMMQTTSAEAYQNQRIKLSGWVKTQDAVDGGHLWLRIDGQKPTDMLGFDNMEGRAPKGTTDWQEYSLVLDVPKESARVNYGFFVKGGGKMWVSGLTVQPVDATVPTTNKLEGKGRELQKAPVNLGFAPK